MINGESAVATASVDPYPAPMSQHFRIKLEKPSAARNSLVRALVQGLDISMQRAHLYVDRLHHRFPAFHEGEVARQFVLGVEGMSVERLTGPPSLHVAPREQAEPVITSWELLLKILEEQARDALEHLVPPAKADDMAALEQTIRREVPPQLSAWLAIHDGTVGASPLPFGMLSCLGIVMTKRQFEIRPLEIRLADEAIRTDSGIRRQWWNPGWIPFADDGEGRYLCIDQVPAEGGEEGQVIEVSADDPYRRRVESSFSSWLCRVAKDLKEGVLVTVEEGGHFYAVMPREAVSGSRSTLTIRGETKDQRAVRIRTSLIEDPQVLAGEILKGLVRNRLILLRAGAYPPVLVLPAIRNALSLNTAEEQRAQAVIEALEICEDVASLSATREDIVRLIESVFV